jgi:DNA (cytosine-5)-methyltransferase 1
MKVLSLFSGVGGFDMGLENAGMETVFQCEWDKHANSILHRHWPEVPKWDDVSTLTGKHILANAPVVDVVAWGSPCQDLSVAGKRAGLEGGRSGLFHEGIRIIKELQEESNGQYPRISIWENVVGALNSNGGADFGVILDEMAQAGALVIEWAVLDAQYFGVPQRRRRVFVSAIFDPVLASRCPNPLLPVAESLPGHLAKGKPKRQSAARTIAEGVGTDGGILGSDIVGSLNTSDAKMISTQYVNENKCVVEPFVKSSRAQTSDDSETWIPGEVNPTLNSFDVGDTRATTAIVQEPIFFQAHMSGEARVKENVMHSLSAMMGTGGNNVPLLAFGIQGNVIGRQDHNGPAGKGHTEDGDPMFTLTSTDIHAVAYPIDTRNALRDPEKYDAQNRQGLGIGNDGDPMATLTSAHVNGVAVQYDGYNQRVNETDVSLTIRIGRDSSDFIAQPTEPTMAVRRLTPLECERLMGWPDNHTLTKADGTTQADTHRYKQCGNGVASPVAQWIAKHLLNI